MSSQVIILIIFVISTFDTIFCHDGHSASKVGGRKNLKALGLVCWGCHGRVTKQVELLPSSGGERSEGKLVLVPRAPSEGSLPGLRMMPFPLSPCLHCGLPLPGAAFPPSRRTPVL